MTIADAPDQIVDMLRRNSGVMLEEDLKRSFTSGEEPSVNLALIIQDGIDTLLRYGRIQRADGRICLTDSAA